MIQYLQVVEADDQEEIAYDGIGEILRRRHIYEIIECEDLHGNTPLSEAAGKICILLKHPVIHKSFRKFYMHEIIVVIQMFYYSNS